MMRAEQLKTLLNDFGIEENSNAKVRIHRAISWLKRSEELDDSDSKCIFLWVAFNAAYSQEIPENYRMHEKEVFQEFWQKICSLDEAGKINNILWNNFTGSIRVLLANQFVFKPFWDYHNGKITEDNWKDSFALANKAANKALASGDTIKILSIVFSRIYTLRNQLVHGGTTWQSQVNRRQVKDCCSILENLIPTMIEIMIENPDTLWGSPCYPVIKD